MSWFAMGNYSTYVWCAYGVAFGVLCLNGLLIRWQRVQVRRKLRQWIKRRPL